jgi:hypothetical protein
MFAFGSIILAQFPFTDVSGEKRRPPSWYRVPTINDRTSWSAL